jgi:hypothetical protein
VSELERGARAVAWTADPAPRAGARPAAQEQVTWTRGAVLLGVLALVWLIDPTFPWWLFVAFAVLWVGMCAGIGLGQRARRRRPVRLAGLLYDPVGHWLTLTMAADRATIARSDVRRVEVHRATPAGPRQRLVVDTGTHRFDTGDTGAESVRPVLDALRADGVQVRAD